MDAPRSGLDLPLAHVCTRLASMEGGPVKEGESAQLAILVPFVELPESVSRARAALALQQCDRAVLPGASGFWVGGQL